MKSTLLARVCAGLLAAGLVPPALAQGTEHAIDLFAFDQNSGFTPQGGVITDRYGTIFGTTTGGGSGGGCSNGCGTVFALAPPADGETHWAFKKLYDFQGGEDGSSPGAQLTLGPAGSLFGYSGLGSSGGTTYGTVFQLSPPATAGSPWQFQILYVFASVADGNLVPMAAPLIAHGGALFGIAAGGDPVGCGQIGCGSVFRLARRPGSTAWTKETVFRFTGGATSGGPSWIVGPDAAGGLYVSTGHGHGVVARIAPPAFRGMWSETVLTRFAGGADGYGPDNLVLANGTLYGLATVRRNSIAFQLTPPAGDSAGWTRTIIATVESHGSGPVSLAQGVGGTLIGAIEGTVDVSNGSVFELTPPPAGGAWTATELWNFNNGPDQNPLNVVTGFGGHLYGVLQGGDSTLGSVFELR